MKNFTVIVAVLAALFGAIPDQAQAQNYRTDAGLLVIEDSLLSTNHKQIVFVVARDINQTTRIELQTCTSEGVINQFAPLQFPQGLRRGQIIPVWNGEFNNFHATPWLNFWLTVITPTETYYCNTMVPINYREAYKEPMITSIGETGGYGVPYTITVRGIFDTTIPSIILLNTNVFIPQRTITQIRPGIIEFTMDSNSTTEFPPGKYLLTLCQASHCDTLEGRHR